MVRAATRKATQAPVTNLAGHLPGLLTVEGKPMSLENHFAFAPVFSTHLPPYFVLRAGRQVGKTHSVMGRLILQAAMNPGHKTLVVLPLQEQSDRLSSVICKPMIEDSPIRALLGGGDDTGSVRRREFPNRAILYFSYAFLDTDRVRSISSRWLYVDEDQDMDGAHVPVLQACTDSFADPMTFFSGTSKTKDTNLEVNWQASSQGVWTVRCTGCGFDNKACVEDGHLLSMLGPYRDDISEARPGTVCHRCQVPVSPRHHGRWVHRYPERLKFFAGYYVPQPIVASHYANPIKWQVLLGRRDGSQGYTQAKFYNEVLGEAFDAAYKLVSISDLQAAGQGIGPNSEAVAAARAARYPRVVLGVDWGGGGEDGISRTKIAAAGLTPDGAAEVFYGASLPPSTDRVAEGQEVLRIARVVRAGLIAHDYNGGGTVSEAVLNHLGWPASQLIPMVYQANKSGDMVAFQRPTGHRARGYYMLDKARTLQFTCMAIRSNRVRFFDYDFRSQDDRGLLHDFLALVEDKVDTPTGDVYRIRRLESGGSDDFAHATNFACCCLWESHQAWPSLAVAGRIGVP